MRTFIKAAAVAIVPVFFLAAAAPCQEGGAAVDESIVLGSWGGAKLRCKKEEGKAVRCGKPEPFDVTFGPDGRGSSNDDRFPREFSYHWESPTEITITPVPEGEELKLFQLELADEFLTFQAYIYRPVEEGEESGEVNYIHYIFDVSKVE